MSGLRWADSSDESEDEVSSVGSEQHAGLNDGSINLPADLRQAANGAGNGGAIVPQRVAGFSSDEESDSSEDEDAAEPSDTAATSAPLKPKKKIKNTTALSKKEKQALKAKDLGDLDDLLNDLGIDAPKADTEVAPVDEEPPSAAAAPVDGKKRRKRRPKKTAVDKAAVPVVADKDEPVAATADVAAVLRSKKKTKAKTAAEIAAATAAKEAKAKKEQTKKKEKRKKKDKYAHGAPSR